MILSVMLQFSPYLGGSFQKRTLSGGGSEVAENILDYNANSGNTHPNSGAHSCTLDYVTTTLHLCVFLLQPGRWPRPHVPGRVAAGIYE